MRYQLIYINPECVRDGKHIQISYYNSMKERDSAAAKMFRDNGSYGCHILLKSETTDSGRIVTEEYTKNDLSHIWYLDNPTS